MAKPKFLLQSVPFVVYGVHWISATHCIVGGGGGHDIPNVIYIMKLGEEKLEVVSEKTFEKDEIVWSMSCSTKQKLICFTSPTKLFTVKYDEEYKLSVADSVELKIDEDDKEKKHVSVNQSGTCVVLCDDEKNINIYEISEEGKLTLKDTIENKDLKKPFGDVNCLEYKSDLYIAATNEKNLIVWKGTKQIANETNLPPNHIFKKCFLTQSGDDLLLVALHTARGSPTIISKYKIADDKHKKVLDRKVLAKPFPLFTISRSDNENDEQFLGVGTPDNGFSVFDLSTLGKRYSFIPNIHGHPVTASDIFMSPHLLDQKKMLVCTGSFDRSVAIHTAKTEPPASNSIYIYFLAVVFLVLGILYSQYFQ